MKNTILIACISALTITFSINAYAKIYKWTDSKGGVHYSATPPNTQKRAKLKAKDIEKKIRFAAGKSHPSNHKMKTQSKNNQAKINQKNSNSELSPPDKKLVDYCKTQKTNLESLKKNFRNIWIDPSGKKTKLNQKQRQEKVDYLKERIKSNCSEVQTD